MAAAIFPWPTRAERKARVELARRRAEEARRKTDESVEVQRDLQKILAQNHFAQAIVEGLMESQKRRPRRGHQ